MGKNKRFRLFSVIVNFPLIQKITNPAVTRTKWHSKPCQTGFAFFFGFKLLWNARAVLTKRRKAKIKDIKMAKYDKRRELILLKKLQTNTRILRQLQERGQEEKKPLLNNETFSANTVSG